jgi:serine/threonine-protein kinase HipA
MTAGREQLPVSFERARVGTLGAGDDERFELAYDARWLARVDAFAISASLPLREAPYAGGAGHWFFANLLPEGQVRQLVARRLGISEANDFELLRALGGECAGALVIGDDPEPDGYETITRKQLAELARQGDALVHATDRAGVRLSLAGAQDKLPVRVDGKRFQLPRGASPSTHIMKFPNRSFRHLPANEAFTMGLAKRLGLPVADVTLLDVQGERILLTPRYDRVAHGDDIVRLHQEDMCQARGVSPWRKYEAEGGPSFADCIDVVTRVSAEPAPDTRALVQWLAFCAIAGNADGHGKNLSMVRSPSGAWRLAPFYDLACTAIYQRIDRNLAMRVGDNADPGKIRGRDWEQLARQAKLGPRFVKDIVGNLAGRIDEEARATAAEFRDAYGDSPVPAQIVTKIRKQARRARQLLAE